MWQPRELLRFIQLRLWPYVAYSLMQMCTALLDVGVRTRMVMVMVTVMRPDLRPPALSVFHIYTDSASRGPVYLAFPRCWSGTSPSLRALISVGFITPGGWA